MPKTAPVIQHALFDWDGTLSLLRAGWGEVMQAQWLAELPPVKGETPSIRERMAHDEIWRLNGKPTIHQMARLAELVADRGGAPRTANEYNTDYQARLAARVSARADRIRNGTAIADDFLVAGARDFMNQLVARGIQLHVASGTELRFIAAEAEWLGLAQFFGDRFHGPAGPDDRDFTKRGVMDRILVEANLKGSSLVAFGDGHVEIEQARAVGGFAVAVCSDEDDWRSRRLDVAKQTRLIAAGAHFCIPDFVDPAAWLPRLPWANTTGSHLNL